MDHQAEPPSSSSTSESSDPVAGSGTEAFFDLHVFVCCNRRPVGHARGSCAARGSERLRDYLKASAKTLPGDRRIRVNTAGCLDRCELGPCLVIYPEGVWYRITSELDVDRVVHEHLQLGQQAVSLLLPGR